MASLSAVFLLLLVCFDDGAAGSEQKPSNLISLGSSIHPNIHPTAWHSSSGRFAFGFYPEGGGFLVGIWLVGSSENTTVWTANRDDPPVSSNATLELDANGKLLLRNEQMTEGKLIANSKETASSASMLDSGNFVLYNKEYGVIWESFKFPTDTLLGGQNLSRGGELFSSLSPTNHSTGRFRLKMQEDGNLVLYPTNTRDTGQNAYWSSGTWGGSQNYLNLKSSGALLVINNTNRIAKIIHEWPAAGSSSYSYTAIYRATIGYDGNFRSYSHNFYPNGDFNTSVWEQIENLCDVKSFCGFNSYCTFNDDQPICVCLPGSDFVDPIQKTSGCDRNFTKESCTGGKENATFYKITSMENLAWDDLTYYTASMEAEECSMSCLEDCDCDAALFSVGKCEKHKFPLKYVRRVSKSAFSHTTAFFKLGTRSIESAHTPQVVSLVTTSKKAWILVLVVSLALVTYSGVALAVSGFYIFKFRVIKYKRLLETGILSLAELSLQSYSYNELRRATNGFKEEIGKGSFGAVYKGALYKGKKLVAVKRLEKVIDEGEKEFRAEMTIIGRTHHKNLVRLLGYCAEGLKRVLVYEYMSNGSLADLLFRAERRPDWNERVRIALDVARGILYLHEECEAPIIHCDIKPQNILMDEFWTPKISDFGLAKLLMPDQTRTFTGVRGTRGYLAPEWHKNTPISVKVDIYSYGIVLLEILCCRRNIEANVLKPEEMVLPAWAYKCFVDRQLNKLVDDEVDKKGLENMVKVALWCIQDEPALRPSIKSVVLMLEGMTDISIPPSPTYSLL